MKYTIYFDQVEPTNFQVRAKDGDAAEEKARRLYKRGMELPSSSVEDGWLVESDGEDK